MTVRGTTADPLHSIPILDVSEFKYTTGRADYTVVAVDELGVGEAYLPHLIGRHYEDVRIHKVGAEWTELKDREEEQESFPVRRFNTPAPILRPNQLLSSSTPSLSTSPLRIHII